MPKNIQHVIDDLFSLHRQISSGDVAAAAWRHPAGRSLSLQEARTRRSRPSNRSRSLDALSSARLCAQRDTSSTSFPKATFGCVNEWHSPNWNLGVLESRTVLANLNFAFTEMVNNAIDHSVRFRC
jgi:hypothetical protein